MDNHSTKVAGIILAAGMSSRLGEPKQLLTYKGKTLLNRVIEAAIQSSLTQVFIVLGHNAGDIQKTIEYSNISIIRNPQYHEGQSSSIRHGIKALAPSVNAVMFLLGDQPLIRSATINILIADYIEKQSLITVPTFEGERGNPVLFDRRLFSRLESLSGDSGGRVLFSEYADQISLVEVDDAGILTDVDTLEDYERLHQAPGENR
ncbi:MAG: molybdenum cofactor cytidylyltransferase [Deltaproteobacteria bacterium]|nr:molybdenum cofactor cytidylyltransferase [Deltaproteobacteria bacterium]